MRCASPPLIPSQALLDLHAKATGLASVQFEGNHVIQRAIKEAFEVRRLRGGVGFGGNEKRVRSSSESAPIRGRLRNRVHLMTRFPHLHPNHIVRSLSLHPRLHSPLPPQAVINQELTSSRYSNTEMIATYADRVLRSGGEKLSEEQIESALDSVVALFTFITDKDVFADIYRNQLCKRLLGQRSASNDAERSMISKLKCVGGGRGWAGV